jgi:hypothetical protein
MLLQIVGESIPTFESRIARIRVWIPLKTQAKNIRARCRVGDTAGMADQMRRERNGRSKN